VRHVTLWPSGLIGRVTAVILIAIVFEFLGSILLHDQIDRYTLREDHARRVAELLVVGERLLEDAPAAERSLILSSLSTEHLNVRLADRSIIESGHDEQLNPLRQQIFRWEPSLAGKVLRLRTIPSDQKGRNDLEGSLLLKDGAWLEFSSHDLWGHWPQLYRTLIAAAVLAGGVLLAAAMIVQTLGAPLRQLARAADQVGHGTPVMVLEQGPPDLRQVSRAFNAMQARISGLIADRTQALAAVGHDLRTPLTRMRLRTGLMRDAEGREALEADIDEMQAMLDSVLNYLRGDNDTEPPKRIDLTALVSTLVDADADLGRDVAYEGPDHLLVEVRPLSLKRALSNLIENGLKYGDRVRVRLSQADDEVRIAVDDDGPGIPEDELARVVAPFFRLDTARMRNTGGLGLGLAIVSQAVEREGGRLVLANRDEGGLRAEIRLPLKAFAT
jgi:signal transduction histidine kinase